LGKGGNAFLDPKEIRKHSGQRGHRGGNLKPLRVTTTQTRGATTSQRYKVKHVEPSGLQANLAITDSNKEKERKRRSLSIFSEAFVYPHPPFFAGERKNIIFYKTCTYTTEFSESMLSEQVARGSTLKLSSPAFIPRGEHESLKNITRKGRKMEANSTLTAESIPSLKCIGANVRSMYAPANFYSICSLLKSVSPDLLFLVETWHNEGHTTLLPDRAFTALLSPHGAERGGGVGIIFKYPLLVTPPYFPS
jgi:hypothetical protein